MTQEHIYSGEKDKYTVFDIEPLARGPFAILYKAKMSNGDLVCIKSFPFSEPKKDWKHYIREIFARKILAHPNILPILDYGEGTDPNWGMRSPFIVMPMCKGGSLRDILRKKDYLSPKELLPTLKQLATAIDYSHEAGIIHGDIKPSNILFLDKDLSHVVLSDFGIAKYFPINEEITNVPDEEGTISYLSPEQIEENQPTPRSDIYALATVVFVALTGKMPYDTKQTTYKQMRTKIEGNLYNPCDINPTISKEFGSAIMWGLKSDTSERPSSASEYVSKMISSNSEKVNDKNKKSKTWWSSLPPAQKVLIVTTIITTIGSIVVAIIAGIFK